MFPSRKRGFSRKKGFLVEPLFWMIDLILIALVLYYSTKYIDTIAEKTTFEKNFLARDLGLLTDAVYVSPGNLVIDYPNSTLWFGFSFGENRVSVFESSDAMEHGKGKYSYMEEKGLEFEKTISPEKDVEDKKSLVHKIPFINNFYAFAPDLEPGTFVNLRFLRAGDTIDIVEQKEQVPNLKQLKCSAIGVKSGFSGDYISTWSTASIKQAITDAKKTEGKKGIHDIIILFRHGNNPDKTVNNIKAYIPINQENFAQSKYLGCAILNELITNEELKKTIKEEQLVDITGISVVPIDVGLTKDNKHVVVIEIGNAQIEQEKSILAKERVLNRAIKTSIENALGKKNE
ncbi:hypothetical protein ACFLZ6_01285 [Nanoarchaeota archaeon]